MQVENIHVAEALFLLVHWLSTLCIRYEANISVGFWTVITSNAVHFITHSSAHDIYSTHIRRFLVDVNWTAAGNVHSEAGE